MIIASFRFILLISFAIILSSCKKDDPFDPNKPILSEEVLTLNNWIWEGMNEIYLWVDQMPDLDPEYQEDPREYFYDLLFSADKYSWIVDDYDELIAAFDGVSLSTGMSVRPGVIGETRVIGILEYVTSNSPASEAGIKRGDVIITIDGQSLNRDNYYTLYNQTTATFEFADWDGSQLVPNGKTITLTAIELNQNPIVHHEVIDYQGKKVGYMVYTQFTAGKDGEWLDELNNVFEGFKSAGVSDMVVDLRYNPGGSLDLSSYIAGTLAPETAMKNEGVFVKLVWNDAYNEFWKGYDYDEDGKPDGENSVQLEIKLAESEFNLNMSTVYFLTTDGTASASESLMTGLYPYVDVVQIGTTSYGKCYGSVTIDDWVNPKRHNWAMQPIVVKYANADGFTDFIDGIDPDFLVEDRLLYAKPFGSLEDPMLAKALEEITGVYPFKKSLIQPSDGFISMPEPPNRMVERRINWPER
jgi:C-terminal processing protease CtpA/Prc